MGYDEQLAGRIRASLGELTDYREIKMFGGLCFTVNTHMVVGVVDDDLMVHVGKDGVDDALANGARQGVMGERTMGGVVMVAEADLPTDESLDGWVGPAVDRARAKPPKPARRPRS